MVRPWCGHRRTTASGASGSPQPERPGWPARPRCRSCRPMPPRAFGFIAWSTWPHRCAARPGVQGRHRRRRSLDHGGLLCSRTSGGRTTKRRLAAASADHSYANRGGDARRDTENSAGRDSGPPGAMALTCWRRPCAVATSLANAARLVRRLRVTFKINQDARAVGGLTGRWIVAPRAAVWPRSSPRSGRPSGCRPSAAARAGSGSRSPARASR